MLSLVDALLDTSLVDPPFSLFNCCSPNGRGFTANDLTFASAGADEVSSFSLLVSANLCFVLSSIEDGRFPLESSPTNSGLLVLSVSPLCRRFPLMVYHSHPHPTAMTAMQRKM